MTGVELHDVARPSGELALQLRGGAPVVGAHEVAHRLLAPLEQGMLSLGRPRLATVVLAVIRGLLTDLDATGDTARIDQTFHDFLTTIENA